MRNYFLYYGLCLCVLLSSFSKHSFAQDICSADTLFLTEKQTFFDQQKKIIVSNSNINSISKKNYTHIFINELFELKEIADEFCIGKSYSINKLSDTTCYQLYFSDFPLVTINSSEIIVDEPNVHAQFYLVEPCGSMIKSNIGIQYRGGYSQTLAKKSLELKFYSDSTCLTTQNVCLLHMTNDDSWNLQAMFNEPLRVRSKTNNDIWLAMSNLNYKELEPEAINGIHMNYVELFLNNEYRGLYCIGEKIKRKQLKLKKYNGNIRGELYKGYTWDGPVVFNRVYPFSNNSDTWGGFEYKHPDEEINWTNLYNFVNFVVNSSNTDFFENIDVRFDMENAVDYFIFLNILRATDNTGKNVYIAKYNNNSPYFFVPWDLDGTMGIIWDGSRDNTTTGLLSNGFYRRLLTDTRSNGFVSKLHSRWHELRKSILATDSLKNEFCKNHNILLENNIYEREMIAWPQYKYENENIDYMLDWMKDRLLFLDVAFNTSTKNESPQINDKSFVVFPNPAQNFIKIKSSYNQYFSCKIYNALGNLVLNLRKATDDLIDIRMLKDGIYYIQMNENGLISTKSFLIKR